jgi:hypothetical protein
MVRTGRHTGKEKKWQVDRRAFKHRRPVRIKCRPGHLVYWRQKEEKFRS